MVAKMGVNGQGVQLLFLSACDNVCKYGCFVSACMVLGIDLGARL